MALDKRYRVKRKRKRDQRSMVTDILAWDYKIWKITPSVNTFIQYADMHHLFVLDRLTTYHGCSVSVPLMVSSSGYGKGPCIRALRRMMKSGIVRETSASQWDLTEYGSDLIFRYNYNFHKFLSGKIKFPIDTT